MDKGKIYKIIRANGLTPENFTSIDNDGSIYVYENNLRYKLNGFSKKILINVNDVSKEDAYQTVSNMMKDYQDDVTFPENIDIKIGNSVEWDIKNSDVWTPPAGTTKGLVRTEEELKRIKSIKKQRGWHFRDEFIDSEGNVYHKGVLQNK